MKDEKYSFLMINYIDNELVRKMQEEIDENDLYVWKEDEQEYEQWLQEDYASYSTISKPCVIAFSPKDIKQTKSTRHEYISNPTIIPRKSLWIIKFSNLQI